MLHAFQNRVLPNRGHLFFGVLQLISVFHTVAPKNVPLMATFYATFKLRILIIEATGCFSLHPCYADAKDQSIYSCGKCHRPDCFPGAGIETVEESNLG